MSERQARAGERAARRARGRRLRERAHEHVAGIFRSDDRQGHERYLGFAAALLGCGLPIVTVVYGRTRLMLLHHFPARKGVGPGIPASHQLVIM